MFASKQDIIPKPDRYIKRANPVENNEILFALYTIIINNKIISKPKHMLLSRMPHILTAVALVKTNNKANINSKDFVEFVLNFIARCLT